MCVLIGITLQPMKLILIKLTVWSFGLACDGPTHNGIPFLEVRIQNCANGNLHNRHLVLVPFIERHTAENTMDLIKMFLDKVCESWRDKWIDFSTDGEMINTG